ncbi:hypothetical protein TorRG33x02_242080 [Trema orientale]|uniref:Uncharacterized protein n=1 Tax=Trema orientale TaxID=63057 RepID=A0A2P5DU28_TREOI|nr:hypothetical protein TorRG33x02_242080 [Trema orientale]
MEKPSVKSAFLVILFLVMAASKQVILRGEARGGFRCPRMIDCNSVCQGFPNCCVNGQCFCQPCTSLSPPAARNLPSCRGENCKQH